VSDKIIIRVDQLRKVYGSIVAVEEVSFEVYEGEIFGMVGPNGAGKTTTTECIEGGRDPDAGAIQVFGMSPQTEGNTLRQFIGVQLQAMWDMVRGIRAAGKTVFLTTHFMEEAERLCDRVAIMDRGKIVALDTPENLIRSISAENRVAFTVEGEFEPQSFSRLPNVTRVEPNGEKVVVHGKTNQVVVDVVTLLVSNGYRFRDLRTEQPYLEDVFMALTGHEMRD
jgi:ABC-type multidrug transport system ATPase subunit